MKQLIILILFSLPIISDGQELWTGLTIGNKFNDRFSGSLEGQLRTNDRLHDIDETFIEPRVDFSVLPWLEVRQSYRYRFEGFKDSRIATDLVSKFLEKKTFSPSMRIRYQRDWEETTSETIRMEGEVEYNHSKSLEPFISYEWFYRITNPAEARKHRITTGISSELTDYLSMKLFYRIDKELNRKQNEDIHIIGALFTIKLHKYDSPNE